MKTTAITNIAFIKYWGNRDHALRILVNGSFSMNLDGLSARTQVSFLRDLAQGTLILNGTSIGGAGLARVS